jgi:hypothetical protein
MQSLSPFHGLADLNERRQGAFLELDSDPLPDRRPVDPRVKAQDLDHAGVRDRSPQMHSTVVVFPAPFGPMMPKISPRVEP